MHTKGPWEAHDKGYYYNIVALPNKGLVATVDKEYDDEMIDANARLIAAAPELLEATIYAYETETSSDVRDKLYSAILKAKGA